MEFFCLKKLKLRASTAPSLNNDTVRRVLKNTGIKQRHAQKKRSLKKTTDLKLQLKFAQKIFKKLPKNSWTEKTGFYIDGASFTHKPKSFDQVRAPKAMVWRMHDLRLDFAFFAKDSQERTGSVGHFMAAIVYRKGVIAAEKYHDTITAEKFPSFIHEQFASMFKKSSNPRGMLLFTGW